MDSSKTQTVSGQTGNFTFAVTKGNYPNHVIKALEGRGNWRQVSEEEAIETCDFFWRQVNLGFSGYDKVDKRLVSSTKPFIFNHFEVIRGICTKTNLIKSLRSYYDALEPAKAAHYTLFDTTPTTFVIARANDDREIEKFMHRFREICQGGSKNERTPNKHCQENMWVVKPAALNQGRGIEVFKNLRDITEFIYQKNQKESFWVVQKYIERPFLYKTRKFDMRIWALVTEDFRIFVYKDGYLRTSSSEYDTNNRSNQVHLTNQCLQVHCAEYGTFEEGNTLTFKQFQEYLNETHPQYNLVIEEHFMPRIKDIIIDSFLSVRYKMNPNRRKHCFELFGFDFLLDEDFRLWLIEINTNPFLGTPNKDMIVLVPTMIEEMLKIAIDPICKPKNQTSDPDQSGFQLIYREENPYDQNKLPAVNHRRPYNLELCYPIPELKPFIGKLPPKEFKKAKQSRKQLLNKKTGGAAELQTEPPITTTIEPVVQTETPTRSRSLIPTKPQIFLRNNIGGRQTTSPSQRSASHERGAKLQDKSQLPKRHNSSSKVNLKAYETNEESHIPDGIAEVAGEEEKLSDNSDTAAATKIVTQQRKNFLCKNLFDQCKELCYNQSQVYKDFDQILYKVITRMQQWMLFDDDEINMAGNSLKLIANSGQLVNLVTDANIQILFKLYDQDDLVTQARLAIGETFLMIAKNIGLRKIFLKPEYHNILLQNALQIVEEQDNPNKRLIEISKNAIFILGQICTVKTNRFYIPGETSISERLRKNAFDSGTFTMLHYINKKLKEQPENQEIKQYLREKILNFVELSDLQYHAKILKLLQENPTQTASSITEENLTAPTTSNPTSNEEQESADKASVGAKISNAAIWAEPPVLNFPPFFMKVLDLEWMYTQLCERIDIVKDRIDKRKEEENKKRLEKQQAQVREQESLIEQKRKRAEEINNRRAEQKKMGIYQSQVKQPIVNLQPKVPQNLLQAKKTVIKDQNQTMMDLNGTAKQQQTPIFSQETMKLPPQTAVDDQADSLHTVPDLEQLSQENQAHQQII